MTRPYPPVIRFHIHTSDSEITIAAVAPKNLVHFVAQNETYEANGGHPIPNQKKVDFAGLAFWGTIVHGDQQLYFFMVKPDGTFAVFWAGDGGFRRVVEPRRHRAVRLGANAPNVLRIVTKGQSATFFINEKQVAVVHTDRTDVPWTAGLIAEGSVSPRPWAFTAFDASR